MSRVVVAAGLVSLSLLPATRTGAQVSQATVHQGKLEGTVRGEVVAFLGVPYAAPPVGDLRWRPPQPAAAWTGVRKADAFAPSAIQPDQRGGFGPWTAEYVISGPVSEDCLYLNVWTPAKSAEERLPVFFWIHGGAFTGGSGSVAIYEGSSLARKGVVVVTVNYRVGPLGFLAHPELSRESDHEVSGNYGLLDIIAALRWVRENIAAFGGDPDRVTIAGQSAGAAAVHEILASPLARGLFVRAIAQSGSGMGMPMRTLQEAEQDGQEFVRSAGAESVRELRSRPAESLIPRMPRTSDAPRPAPRGRESATPPLRFGPLVDGWVLPRDYEDRKARGEADVPLLTGLTADEGSASPDYGRIKADAFKEQARRRLGDRADAFLTLYPADSDDQAGRSQKASSRDRGLASLYFWARSRAESSKAPLYIYFYDHPEPGPQSDRYGAFHSSEIPYVFGTLDKADRPFTQVDRDISRVLSSYWANFIKAGDPNGSGLPEWPAFRADANEVMELGERFGPRPLLDAEKLDFYKSFVARGGRLSLF